MRASRRRRAWPRGGDWRGKTRLRLRRPPAPPREVTKPIKEGRRRLARMDFALFCVRAHAAATRHRAMQRMLRSSQSFPWCPPAWSGQLTAARMAHHTRCPCVARRQRGREVRRLDGGQQDARARPPAPRQRRRLRRPLEPRRLPRACRAIDGSQCCSACTLTPVLVWARWRAGQRRVRVRRRRRPLRGPVEPRPQEVRPRPRRAHARSAVLPQCAITRSVAVAAGGACARGRTAAGTRASGATTARTAAAATTSATAAPTTAAGPPARSTCVDR